MSFLASNFLWLLPLISIPVILHIMNQSRIKNIDFSSLRFLRLIEHDSIIHNHCHIATSAKINGRVEIGKSSFIGGADNVHTTIEALFEDVTTDTYNFYSWLRNTYHEVTLIYFLLN